MSKRRSLAPLAKSKAAAHLLAENDDEAEKLVRRKSLAAFRQKRKSMAFAMAGEDEEAEAASAEVVENKENIKKALDSYSEMIKLCASKKLNVKNTWSLSLIDHIDHILDSHQGSFQKASCTLQASVQIYEKRVDSTHMDTFRMLENVNRSGKRSEADGERHREFRRKHKGKSNGSTLETNLNNITSSQVEKEYEVDPLFRKMSKTFDEGGAEGMLLNHLLVHSGPRVIFDTSNTQAFPQPEKKPAELSEEEEAAFFEAISSQVPEDLSELHVCKTIETLRHLASSKGYDVPHSSEDVPQLEENYLSDDNDYFAAGGVEEDEDFDQGNASGAEETTNPPIAEKDELSQEREAKLIEDRFFAAGGHSETEYSYFSQNAQAKSWAGPTFWRFGKPAPLRTASAAAKPKTARKAKKSYFIDFTADLDHSLYAEPKKHNAITLIKAANLKQRKQFLLPEDVHYTPKDLSQLFLRPENVRIRMVTRQKDNNDHGHEVGQDNQAAPMSELEELPEKDDYDYFDPATGGADYFEDDATAPLENPTENTGEPQHDFGPLGSIPFVNGMEFVQPNRKVDKIEIEFARKAKRVNVIKLKKDIWEEIEECEDKDSSKPAEQREKRSFCESIVKLEPKVDDTNVTIPFYFICLLHLANEKGLELEGQDDLSDFQIIV